MFISSQQNRSIRLEFSSLKQKKTDTITEFYSSLLYLAKASKMININSNQNVKDRFIDGLKSIYIRRKLLEDETSDQSLNDLMLKAVNLETIEKNLPRQHSSTTHSNASGVEPMEIGTIAMGHGWRPWRPPPPPPASAIQILCPRIPNSSRQRI